MLPALEYDPDSLYGYEHVTITAAGVYSLSEASRDDAINVAGGTDASSPGTSSKQYSV